MRLPPLEDLLAASSTILEFQAHNDGRVKTALIPVYTRNFDLCDSGADDEQGMGRGYDTLLFAKHGYSTVGLGISGFAVCEAKKWVGIQLSSLTKSEKKGYAPIRLVLADFFDDEWLKMMGLSQKGGFNAIYDYAVSLSALPAWIY